MKLRKNFISLVLLGAVASTGYTAEDAGLPGEFLNFGAGARPMGMGRAFTGLADDVDSILFNPAGLATYRRSEVEFQRTALPVDGDESYLAYSQPIYANGSIGAAILNVDAGELDRINSQNINVGTFDARETAYLVSYGHRFGDIWSGGATLKMAENSIDGRTERGFGADLGSLYQLNPRVRFGAMLRNALQPTYSFATDKEEFPRIFRAGASMKFFDNHLTTVLDLSKTIGVSQGLKYHFGMEGYVIDNIFLRAGIDETEITTGLGIRWRNIQFDYAGGFQDLGFINRLAVKFFFGGYDVDVKARPTVFSPTGLKNKVTFKISTSHRERVVKWIMTIRDPQNDVVRSYQGFNEPPRIIEWDGTDQNGQAVKPGRYTYQMLITDAKDNREKTPRRSIRVVAPSPFEIEAR